MMDHEKLDPVTMIRVNTSFWYLIMGEFSWETRQEFSAQLQLND